MSGRFIDHGESFTVDLSGLSDETRRRIRDGLGRLLPDVEPMRIVETDGLGWRAAVVEIEGETVLLLDSALSEDERLETLHDAFGMSL